MNCIEQATTEKSLICGHRSVSFSVSPVLIYTRRLTALLSRRVIQGILLSFLLTGGHPFEPNSSQSSSSSSISSSSKSPASATSIFGPTASEELKENVVELNLCKNVVRGDVGLPRFKFGSHDFAGKRPHFPFSFCRFRPTGRRGGGTSTVLTKLFE